MACPATELLPNKGNTHTLYIDMCGRYSQTLTPDQIDEAFGPITLPQNLKPNYNVAPTQLAPVITNRHPQQVELFEWGLVPFWSKDGKNTAKMINARSEGILSKPSFRKPIRERRCLVIGDSFYEWRREGKQKQPYRITPSNGEPLVLAGIWEYWRDKQDEENQKLTFSIITTEPNAEMSKVHNRMPVVLNSPALREAWLSELSEDEIVEILHTPPDGSLQLYAVPPLVNSVRNNGPELHAPLDNS